MAKNNNSVMPSISDIMAWENGEMSPEEEIIFFQDMINSGVVWQLQGGYGRRATQLINDGDCDEPKDNFYIGMGTVNAVVQHGRR